MYTFDGYEIDTFDATTRNYGGADGQQVDQFTDSRLVTGVSSNVVVGSDNIYLYIAQSPMVSVEAHVGSSDADTASDGTLVFGPDDTGTLYISIADTVVDAYDGNNNYVLMPLPTVEDGENALQTDADFDVTFDTISTSFTGKTGAADPVYDIKYVTFTEDTLSDLAAGDLATLYTAESSSTSYSSDSGHNAIVVAITSQPQYSTIDLEIAFSVDDHTADAYEYITLSGMTCYYSGASSRSLYFSGTAPSGQDEGGTFVNFAYYYPAWDIEYAAFTIDSDGTESNYTITDTYTTDSVSDGSALGAVTDPTAPTGYEFKGWYTDEDLTEEYDSSDEIYEDTTLYAKFTAVGFTVSYDYDSSYSTDTTHDTTTAYWTGTFGTLPTADTRTGYTFDGWYYIVTGDTPSSTKVESSTAYSDIDTTGADNIILTAKYTATTYTVTYNLNGGSVTTAIGDQTYAWDTAFAFPTETVTKSGYTFEGWAKTNDAATALTAAGTYGDMSLTTSDVTSITLYAVWTEKEYEIAFDLNDGDDTSDPDSYEGIKIMWTGQFSNLVSPTRAGYTFAGWYYGDIHIEDGDYYYADIGVDSNADAITIKATWTEKTDYTLTFNYQDDSTTDEVDTVEWTEEITLPTPAARKGYTFLGWSADSTAATATYTAGSKTTFKTIVGGTEPTEASAILYGVWSVNEYTITFNTTYTTSGDTEITGTTTQTTLENFKWTDTLALAATTGTEPSNSSYHLIHWDYEYATDLCYPVTNGLTLEAALGSVLTDADLTDRNIVLNAHYLINEITMTYVVPFKEGMYSTTETTQTLSTVIDADNTIPTAAYNVSGYTFNGWKDLTIASLSYVASADTPKTYYTSTNESQYANNASNTLTGVYTENSYTITYDLNYGTNNTLTETTVGDYTYNWTGTVTLPTPTRTGYTFTGWYTGSDGKTGKISDGTYSSVIGTTFDSSLKAAVGEGTLYAGWTANTYTVTFDLNYTGASKLAEQTVGWDVTDVTSPTEDNPTRTGYTFKGWSTADDATTASYTASSFDKVYSAIFTSASASDAGTALYAIWTPIEYTVTYDLEDGTAETTIADVKCDYDATFTPTTTTVTKEGFTFIGWFTGTNGTGTAADTKTYSELFGATNVTLYAYWTNKAYTITFLNTGATEAPTAGGNWSDAIVVATPTKTGYTFAGWYATDASEPTSTDAIAITSGTTTFSDILDNDDTSTLSLRAWWTENTPSVQVNYSDELLTNLVPRGTYTINGVEYTADTSGTVAIDDSWLGTTLSIIRVAEVDYTFNSAAFSLTLIDRPDAPYSTLADDETYTGAQPFELECEDDDDVTIYYYILEHNDTEDSDDNYVLVDSGVYDPDHTYSMKETAQLVIYCVDADGLKSYEVTYDYIIIPNLTVSYADGVSASTQMITAINSSNEDNNDWINDSTLSNFGLIRIEDEDASDDDIVTTEERAYLNEAMPSGYSEVSAFQLHATVNDEVILDTVELASRVTIVIELEDMSSRKTYQVLHMKHGSDGSDDVEIFTTDSADVDLLLTADYTAKTLTLSVGSLSPFMVVSKSTSSSSSNTGTLVTTETTETTATLDTENHFAYMQGYTDGTFGATLNITRAETIVMFSRLLMEKMDDTATYSSSFSDVTADLWYANAVGYMEQFGIISGYPDGTFRGDETITRAEFATIASRFDDLVSTGENPFSDVSDTHWAVSYINSASAKGWITGYTDGTFLPEKAITRAEAVTLVNRVLDRVCDEDFADSNLTDMRTFSDVESSYWAYYQILEAANGHQYTKTNGMETWTSLD